MSRKIKSVNFLPGAAPWKARWGAEADARSAGDTPQPHDARRRAPRHADPRTAADRPLPKAPLNAPQVRERRSLKEPADGTSILKDAEKPDPILQGDSSSLAETPAGSFMDPSFWEPAYSPGYLRPISARTASSTFMTAKVPSRGRTSLSVLPARRHSATCMASNWKPSPSCSKTCSAGPFLWTTKLFGRHQNGTSMRPSVPTMVVTNGVVT